MALSIKSFQNTAGAVTGPRYLVARTPATEVAFIDHNWGCRGSEVTIADQGMTEGQTLTFSGDVPDAGYPLSIEVCSHGGPGEFSLSDGSAWQGPYAVTADTPLAMLVRFTPAVAVRPLSVKFKALQATNRVLIQARQCPSPAQMAAV